MVSVLPSIGFPVFGQRGGTCTSFDCCVSLAMSGFLMVFKIIWLETRYSLIRTKIIGDPAISCVRISNWSFKLLMRRESCLCP